MANTIITTEICEVKFSHVRTTEVILGKDTGKYALTVSMDKDDLDILVGRLQDEWDAYTETIDRNLPDPMLGVKEYKGEKTIRFTLKSSFQNKAGETITKTIPLFDSLGNKINDWDGEIPYGSKVKVCFNTYPFVMGGRTYGFSLQIKAVQIIELAKPKEKMETAEAFGFAPVVGGFVAKQTKAPEDEGFVPHDEDESLPWERDEMSWSKEETDTIFGNDDDDEDEVDF